MNIGISPIHPLISDINTALSYKTGIIETPDAPGPDSSPSLLHAKSITVVTDRGFMNSCIFPPSTFKVERRVGEEKNKGK